MFLWKEKLQPLSLLDVQENNQSISFKAEKASVAHGTRFIWSFSIRINSRSCFGILLCNSTFQYLVENQLLKL